MDGVEGVGCLQAPVERVVHHRGGQGVEAGEVRQHTTGTLTWQDGEGGQRDKGKDLIPDVCKCVFLLQIDTDVYLHHKRVYDVVLGQEPVSHLLLSHRGRQLETPQVFLKQLCELAHIPPLHGPEPWGLCALCGRRGGA